MSEVRKIRVLYLPHRDGLNGGANKALIDLINSVSRWIIPMVVVTANTPEHYMFNHIGVQCIVLPRPLSVPQHVWSRRQTRCETFIKWFPRIVFQYLTTQYLLHRLSTHFQRGEIDIVHTNTAVISIGDRVAKKIKAKHVWHLREFLNLDHQLEPMWGWKRMRHKVAQADATISITHSVQRHYLTEIRQNDYCFKDATIKSASIEPIRTDKRERAFFFIGTLVRSKGIEVAIQAFSKFYQTHPGYILYIAGHSNDVRYLRKLEFLIIELGLKRVIKFLGQIDNPEDYYKRTIALLMCSEHEALGRTTIEAMNNGCVVIGHNTGGTSELIQHTVTGFLYDTEVELLRYMEYVAVYDCSLMQNVAFQYVQQNFTLEAYGPKIRDVYKAILA